MNKKGQALVEFVLILPIFIMILFVVYDFGNIFSKKNELENISSDIVELYKNDTEKADIMAMYSDLDIKFDNYKDKYVKITIMKNINIITPGLDKIIGKDYKIEIERVVPNA